MRINILVALDFALLRRAESNIPDVNDNLLEGWECSELIIDIT